MILLPSHLVVRYQDYCRDCGIKDAERSDYLKWLRFFLDFSEKYQVAGEGVVRIRKFMDKLKEKKQSEDQRRRAYHAISLYFKMLQENHGGQQSITTGQLPTGQQIEESDVAKEGQPSVNIARKSYYSEAGYQEKSSSPEWDEVIAKMADEIKLRHYSRKTLKTYALWSRKFQQFLRNKPPTELGSDDVKAYLTHLAVDCRVAMRRS